MRGNSPCWRFNYAVVHMLTTFTALGFDFVFCAIVNRIDGWETH
jgi:hypothetical protein